MPRKRVAKGKRRPYRRRRRYVRRLKNPFQGSYLRAGRGMLPDKLSTRTKLCSTPADWEPAGVTNTFCIYLNSLYDPLNTWSDDKPKDFNCFDNIYGRYYVWGGWYKITFMNQTNSPCQIAHAVFAYTTAPTSFKECAEAGRTILIAGQDEGGSNRGVIKGRWKANRFVDTKKDFYSLCSNVNVNPTRLICLHLYGSSTDGATNININVIIEMGFNIRWFDHVGNGLVI